MNAVLGMPVEEQSIIKPTASSLWELRTQWGRQARYRSPQALLFY